MYPLTHQIPSSLQSPEIRKNGKKETGNNESF